MDTLSPAGVPIICDHIFHIVFYYINVQRHRRYKILGPPVHAVSKNTANITSD